MHLPSLAYSDRRAALPGSLNTRQWHVSSAFAGLGPNPGINQVQATQCMADLSPDSAQDSVD